MKESKKIFSQEDIMKLLDACYEKSLDGIPHVSPPVEKMASDYLEKHATKELAMKAMLNNQVVKCTTSGFITGFGGFITMPVTIPANIGSVIYVQMRMIACCAHIMGYDLKSDQTQTFIYACLAGVALNGVIKKAGQAFGIKMAQAMVNKIPGKVLIAINQKVGFRFITKAGTKGIVNIGKAVPVVGAVVSGGFDLVETKIIANRAYKWFHQGDFVGDEDKPEDIIDVDFADVEVENSPQ